MDVDAANNTGATALHRAAWNGSGEGDGPDLLVPWPWLSDRERPGQGRVYAVAERLYWGGDDPVGRRIVVGIGKKFPVRVVGVVSDLREADERKAPAPSVYLPMNQVSCLFYNFRTIVVRTERAQSGVGRDAARAMAGVDPRLPVAMVRADEALASRRDGPRFYAAFVGLAGLLGLLPAAVGMAGITAQGVTRRTREIGVRAALGAGPGALVRIVTLQACVPVISGAAAGLAGALGLSRLMTAFLYEVTPHDPMTHALAVVLLLSIAFLAAWLPARRAARINPVDALRAE